MTRLRAALIILALLPPLPALAGGDPAAGEAVFRNRCSDCHSLTGEAGKAGPSLAGLIGRTAGTLPGYDFSPAMQASGIIWGADTLAQYLAAPRKMVPQTRMAFNGLKRPGESEDLLAWLLQAAAP